MAIWAWLEKDEKNKFISETDSSCSCFQEKKSLESKLNDSGLAQKMAKMKTFSKLI